MLVEYLTITQICIHHSATQMCNRVTESKLSKISFVKVTLKPICPLTLPALDGVSLEGWTLILCWGWLMSQKEKTHQSYK